MISITIAIVLTTLVSFLFPATRIFSAIGTFVLAVLFPIQLAVIATIVVAGFAFYPWTKP